MSNIENIKKLNLHDWELNNISVDYSCKKITVDISYEDRDNKKNKTIVLENAVFLEISFREPWGEGIYIYECKYYEEDGNIHMNILLNSGDNINISTSNIEIYD